MASAIAALNPGSQRLDALEPDRQRTTTSANSGRTAAAHDTAFTRALDSAGAPQLVAPVRTRLDAGQASAALRTALRDVTGEEPSEGTVRVLTAQWAHETGQGASMFNYNFGGIKGTGPSGLSVAQRTHEGYGDNERAITDRFRAYTTPEEGATDYVKLLATRYPEAMQAAKNSDPVGFVQGLKTRGYFTGDPVAYTRSVVSLSGMAIPVNTNSAPSLSPAVFAQSPFAGHAPSYDMPLGSSSPRVDSLALVDEISRAALRIAAATTPSGEQR